jgi:uncharacterized LabA/DUF88 family protein
MLGSDFVLGVFIDYDNLTHGQKTAGILDVVTKALIQVEFDNISTRAKCDVRVYGGWYEGNAITRLAEEVSIEIQRDFPAVIRLPKPSIEGSVGIFTNAEIAVAMMQEPGHHLFNTYRKKSRPNNIRVESPSNIGCHNSSCLLPLLKKFLSNGKCPKSECSTERSDLIYRSEQKIVDTMLSCDLIYSANEGINHVILISGDDDFIPPLRSILLRGASAVRFHPKQNSQRASFPEGGIQLIEMDL